MTFAAFVESTAQSHPPDHLSPELRALWFAKKGDWHAAHEIAQDIHTLTGSWIHAHLHLVEGDTSNGGYWYRLAGRPARSRSGIPAEWEEIARLLLGE